MNRKLKITLWILLPIVVILAWNWQLVYLLLMYQTPHMDDAVSESWSLSNGTFEVFVNMHLEQGGFMPGRWVERTTFTEPRLLAPTRVVKS